MITKEQFVVNMKNGSQVYVLVTVLPFDRDDSDVPLALRRVANIVAKSLKKPKRKKRS